MSRRYLRPGVLVGHLLVLAAALTCLRLGWWQWDVSREARGTVQNLGYALLWPVFAGSFIYMWLRFLHLESEREADAAGAGSGGESAPGAPPANPPEERPGGLVAGRFLIGDEDSRPPGTLQAELPAVDPGRAELPAATSKDAESAGTEPEGDGSDEPRPGDSVTGSGSGGDEAEVPSEPGRRRRTGRRTPTETYTVAVATVGGDDDDDPELAAYNKALAALAEQDRRRAR